MNAADFFAAAERLPLMSLDEITGGRGLVIVAPHPDDESLGCGGLIAAACERGIDTRLVVVSDGTGSHPNSKAFPKDKLRQLREEETRAAADMLGLPSQAITFLGLPDRFVPIEGPEADQARRAMKAAVAQSGAGVICVTWRHDPHCDHQASARLVDGVAGESGARILAYPVWGSTLAPGTDVGGAPRGVRLDIARYVAKKREAIFAHRSQTSDLIEDDPNGFRLSSNMIENFQRPFEIFLDVESEL